MHFFQGHCRNAQQFQTHTISHKTKNLICIAATENNFRLFTDNQDFPVAVIATAKRVSLCNEHPDNST
ncbi:MAG: hypothetical protein IPH58_18485 [Sphingobacteriales bacterium]|nr:hypothetical protein [Sphingobacteriales bacterium]